MLSGRWITPSLGPSRGWNHQSRDGSEWYKSGTGFLAIIFFQSSEFLNRDLRQEEDRCPVMFLFHVFQLWNNIKNQWHQIQLTDTNITSTYENGRVSNTVWAVPYVTYDMWHAAPNYWFWLVWCDLMKLCHFLKS